MRGFIIISIVAGILCSSGCASKYGAQQTSVNYYPACYRPIEDLRSNENNVAKSTAGGGILGAFGGAVIGLLASGGKWQGAVAGAAVGGAAGTMAGNAYGRHQQEQEDNIRLSRYMEEIDGDISNLTVASAAARASLQCYDRQFALLLAAIRARQIGREAAAARFAEISSGREEAIAILGNAVEHGSNLNQEYEKAFASEESQISAPQKVARDRTAYARNAKAIKSARNRKEKLVTTTAAIKSEREQALNDSSRQTMEINNAMAALEDLRR